MPVYDLRNERLQRRALKKLAMPILNGVWARTPKTLRVPVALCALLVLVYLIPSPQGQLYSGNAAVIDGDTLQIEGQRFRLYGIDAPEARQTCERKANTYPCGEEATTALAGLVAGQTVGCEKQDIDKYGRIVAVCRVGEMEINKWLVANGYAVSYRKYSGRYILDEMNARLAGKGVWGGTFQMPWDYRHRNR